MNIKGIIFDYGGTLDTGGDHWSKVIQDGWNKAGVAADDALFREAYVYAEKELDRTEHILPQHNFSDLLRIKIELELGFLASHGHFPPAKVEEKSQEIADYCYSVAKDNSLKVKPLLDKLTEKYPLVLVSNFYSNLSTVLKDFGLSSYFKEIIESSAVGVRKPDVEIFKMGIKALKMKPEEVLVVGDSLKKDIEPARSLGCQTLWLRGRKWIDGIIAPQEIKAIDSLEEILNFVE